jgi:hypothetical protein
MFCATVLSPNEDDATLDLDRYSNVLAPMYLDSGVRRVHRHRSEPSVRRSGDKVTWARVEHYRVRARAARTSATFDTALVPSGR